MNQASPPALRIGLGYDTHRIGPARPFLLGGVEIPWDRGLIGHSDADVLLHAITDALLGAASLGDIGRMYPDTDPENKDRDSGEMLAEAMRRVRVAGWEIVNLDCVVRAQQPKISPHAAAICARIAEILAISVDSVGIKGKTGEHVGPVGRQEAIEARCVALLYRRLG
ncbi:2-C-methyl-D-erythritol 2,4-cyclodiphosphate synthase [Rosistilla oblonga]|uniref:2-C-methyl-D-erythritol 2,4-cyclodiphosphate synthase n=1 Tax=Rosistilla oblonga TaxID=2527990 RepID=UPI00118CBEA6|nr:2-C-methyl-D-erythritol 2,4-cyclodiphosphate synthase [Rosistilla oblonga]QDV11016.1 2-C-methyl-D-erythritol 2,4-cyclodiphosphate synthase [Rosistilla oblonga]